MTKIKNYPLDLEVNGGDKWIGTDSQSLAKLTKNFTPDNLAKYYNDKEVINMVNAMRFVYDTVDPGDERISGGFSFPVEVGPVVPFSSISSLIFSKYTLGSVNVSTFFSDIVGGIIIIQKADNQGVFAFYRLNSYEIDPVDGDFYSVGLAYISGSGSINQDEDYLVALVYLAGSAVDDKSYTFTQSVPSTTWSVAHNLQKFPSITVVDSASTVVTGEYTYINNNNVTLTFSAAFAGKAYLN